MEGESARAAELVLKTSRASNRGMDFEYSLLPQILGQNTEQA
jgi:hypothetical protein